MNIEKLMTYTQRKELSNKAKKEVINLLLQDTVSNPQDIKQLVEILVKFHSDILYDYIMLGINHINQGLVTVFLDELKNIAVNKSKYILVAIAALANVERKESAQTLFANYINTFAGGKKIDKRLFIEFEKACTYNGSDIFFEKVNWDRGTINLFRIYLVDCLNYLNNEDLRVKAKGWFEKNGITPATDENKALMSVSTSTPEQHRQESEGGVSSTGKPKTSIPVVSDKTDIPTIIELLNSKYNQLNNTIKEKDKENNALSKELKDLKLTNSELNNKLYNQTVVLDEKERTIVERDSTICGLNREIEGLIKTQKELNSQLSLLKSKLDNMQSAYGQAGQNEIGDLKNRIKARLASEHEKYMEIKAKEPDLDYYEILLAMLDEIYKVLRKNGIDF